MSYVLNGGKTGKIIDGSLSLDGFKFPVKNGLCGLYMMNKSIDTLGVNYGLGNDADIIGDPLAGNGFTELSGDGYLDTKLPETAGLTVVLAVGDSNEYVGYFGNYYNDNNRGASIYTVGNSDVILFSADREQGSGLINMNKSNSIALYSMRANEEGNFAENHTISEKKQRTALGGRSVSGVGTFTIGKLGQVSFKNPTKIAFLALFDRHISDAELEQVVSWARTSLSKYGITV